jgi:transposase
VLVVLGYSRLLYVEFVPRQTALAVMQTLEHAFHAFGGVPREVLFDQLKAVIVTDHRGDGGRLLENAEFARFAAHWNFRIRACRAYRAQTKGKVERPVQYLRDNFVYGRTLLGDADLAAQCTHWLETVANVRVHGTTKEVPAVRWIRDEQPVLQPLAARAYRSLVLSPPPVSPARLPRPPIPEVVVEQRALTAYADYAEAI